MISHTDFNYVKRKSHKRYFAVGSIQIAVVFKFKTEFDQVQIKFWNRRLRDLSLSFGAYIGKVWS